MKQGKLASHAEAMTQNIVGLIIAFLVLHLYGVPMNDSIQIQAILFIASYVRSYTIRRIYNGVTQ